MRTTLQVLLCGAMVVLCGSPLSAQVVGQLGRQPSLNQIPPPSRGVNIPNDRSFQQRGAGAGRFTPRIPRDGSFIGRANSASVVQPLTNSRIAPPQAPAPAVTTFQPPVPQVNRQVAPAQPALSPYLNFFTDNNPGVLDPFNAFVRPSLELQRTINQQNAAINRLGNQVQQVQQAPTPAGVTGIGGSFRNYMHYYPRKR